MQTKNGKIALGGGCHWCTEAVFQALAGVRKVDQGFVRSDPPADSWSEAVIVHFNAEDLPLDVLIEIHLRTHASTSAHKLRGKYRSAIYVFDDKQAKEVGIILQTLQAGFEEPLVTQVLTFAGFKPSDTRFHDYYASGPEKPFCRTYIDPKLSLLRKRYRNLLAT